MFYVLYENHVFIVFPHFRINFHGVWKYISRGYFFVACIYFSDDISVDKQEKNTFEENDLLGSVGVCFGDGYICGERMKVL